MSLKIVFFWGVGAGWGLGEDWDGRGGLEGWRGDRRTGNVQIRTDVLHHHKFLVGKSTNLEWELKFIIIIRYLLILLCTRLYVLSRASTRAGMASREVACIVWGRCFKGDGGRATTLPR